MINPSLRDSPFRCYHRIGAQLNQALFRATKGRLGNTYRGAPVLVLDHIGRKTAQARTTALIYLDDAPDLVIVASKMGADAHPSWFHNLMAMPTAQVELPGGVHRQVRPRLATDAERDTLWPRLVAIYRDYATYARRTGRTIPLVVLEPVARSDTAT